MIRTAYIIRAAIVAAVGFGAASAPMLGAFLA